jgi:hypothetical protein
MRGLLLDGGGGLTVVRFRSVCAEGEVSGFETAAARLSFTVSCARFSLTSCTAA